MCCIVRSQAKQTREKRATFELQLRESVWYKRSCALAQRLSCFSPSWPSFSECCEIKGVHGFSECDGEPSGAAALLRRNGGCASLSRMPGRLLRAVSWSNSATGQLLRHELLCCSTGPAHIHHVRRHPRQPAAPRVRRAVRGAVLGDGVPEAVPVLLPEMLRGLPVRAGGHLRQQGVLPLLRQLEDQEGRPQVPLAYHLIWLIRRKIELAESPCVVLADETTPSSGSSVPDGRTDTDTGLLPA